MGKNPIFDAIDVGDVGRVRELVATDSHVAAARDDGGLSAVTRAAYLGRGEVVDALLAAGPELDLFDAAAVGRSERVRELVDADAGLLSARSADGFTPLHLASFFGHLDVVELLLERDAPLEVFAESDFAPVTPLQSAAAAGETEIARRLLDAGAEVNVRGRGGGFTPLHSAAQNGDAELVRLLLARGAEAGAKTDDGRTPRDLAAGNDEVLALLPTDD